MTNKHKTVTDILKMKLIVILLCGVTMWFSACQTDTVYHQYQTIPTENGWLKKDTLVFNITPKLAGHHFNLEIDIRHSELYPYQDIWIEIRHPFTPHIVPDTLHLLMADKDGNWKGQGKAFSFYQFTQQAGYVTLYPADSVLQLIPIMKDNALKGIHDVGIRLSTFTGSINTQKDKK